MIGKPAILPGMDPLANFDAFLSMLMAAFQSGQWSLLAVLAIVGAVAGARYVLGKKFPFFKGDLGGTLLAFVGGFCGSVAVAFAGGTALLSTFVPALSMTFAAMGGWATVKRLIMPLLSFLLSKLGFASNPVAAAEKAGKTAVESKPANGAGAPREID